MTPIEWAVILSFSFAAIADDPRPRGSGPLSAQAMIGPFTSRAMCMELARSIAVQGSEDRDIDFRSARCVVAPVVGGEEL